MRKYNMKNRNKSRKPVDRTCPHCHSRHVIHYGAALRRGGRVQRYACTKCGSVFT